MKKLYIILGIVVVVLVIGSIFVANEQIVQPRLNDRTVTDVVSAQIESEEYSVSFRYPSGLEGYSLIEPPVATSSQSLKKAYLLFEYSQYIEYQNAGQDATTPPTVSVFVFALPEKGEEETGSRLNRLMQWINENPQYTSFNRLVGDTQEVDIDGVSAIKYSTQGIYNQDFHIVSYTGNAYVFASQYETLEDENVRMYENLINSVNFY